MPDKLAFELVSPERFFAPEMGGMNHVPYMHAFQEKGVTITINTRLRSVRREDVDLDDLAYMERERLAEMKPELAVRAGTVRVPRLVKDVETEETTAFDPGGTVLVT